MKRTIRFGLLLNSAEKEALARLAETEGGLSLGAMIRSLIRAESRKRGLWLAGDDNEKLRRGAHGRPRGRTRGERKEALDRRRAAEELDNLGIQASPKQFAILRGIKQLSSEEASAKAAGRHEEAREARRATLNLQAELWRLLHDEQKAGDAS